MRPVTLIEHAFDESGPVLAGAPFGDGDVTASRQRFDLQENLRHAVAHILVVVDLTVPRSQREGSVDFADQLLIGFVHADERELRVIGRVVKVEHLFHADHKSGAAIGWDFPVFAQVRLKFVFLAPGGYSWWKPSAQSSTPQPSRPATAPSIGLGLRVLANT